MAEILERHPEPVTLVPTGPLTNVAALLLAHPELKSKIARISLMGGGVQFGKLDPRCGVQHSGGSEAADVVFSSGIPIIMAGLDVTEKGPHLPGGLPAYPGCGQQGLSGRGRLLEFFYGFHRKMGYPGAPVHDAVAVAALVRPEILTMQEMYVAVETQ